MPRVDTKRRLPVLNAPANGEDDAPTRPPWQWVGFGTLAIFAAWLPLAFAAAWLASRLDADGSSHVTSVVILGAGLGLAALAGGFLVGRWGAPGVGVREAALAGLATALIASALAFGAPGAVWGALTTVLVAVPFAALGGRLGVVRRRRSA
jgi:tRNA-(ms[2]io[6]A)-hydroxylase